MVQQSDKATKDPDNPMDNQTKQPVTGEQGAVFPAPQPELTTANEAGRRESGEEDSPAQKPRKSPLARVWGLFSGSVR